jgi:putative DNA primase/helicase
MKVSTVFANAKTTTVDVSSLDELAKLATLKHYSLGTFKNGHRNNENFIQAEAIGLDFDEGMTIDEAKVAFSSYKHAILPSKSHRKDKNGLVADRFRVFLFLSKPITDIETYYATWHSIADKFPAADRSCKDPARQYYKSPSIEERRRVD